MQLAAYAEGLNLLGCRCGILFVQREKPKALLVEVPQDQIVKGWLMFKALLDYYYAKTGLQR
jgi:hypothetical protein